MKRSASVPTVQRGADDPSPTGHAGLLLVRDLNSRLHLVERLDAAVVIPGAGTFFLCRHWIGSIQLILALGVAIPLLFFSYGAPIYIALLIWSEAVVLRTWRTHSPRRDVPDSPAGF